jgi:hypothetical protein
VKRREKEKERQEQREREKWKEIKTRIIIVDGEEHFKKAREAA